MIPCREILTSLGPSFVKAGQVLASRPDIVREDYMNELCTLQDDVPSFPDDQVKLQHIPGYFHVGTTAAIKHKAAPSLLATSCCVSTQHTESKACHE